MKAKIIVCCLLAPLLIFIAGCTQNEENETAGLYPLNDREFKEWLRDTLALLGKSEDIYVSEDSLGLTIRKNYDVAVGGTHNKETANLIDLVKEIEELPKNKCRIRFQAIWTFTTTPVEEIKYDLWFNYEKIEVTNLLANTLTEYSYIRGRLDKKGVKPL